VPSSLLPVSLIPSRQIRKPSKSKLGARVAITPSTNACKFVIESPTTLTLQRKKTVPTRRHAVVFY
jgi:hypothetical protein